MLSDMVHHITLLDCPHSVFRLYPLGPKLYNINYFFQAAGTTVCFETWQDT